MPEPLEVWIGKEKYGGVPTPTKRESAPPPHWRLEAIAATERPRSLTVAPDGKTLVFIQDRDTSDLWALTLGDRESPSVNLTLGGAPQRLTTGRDPMPFWEDTTPAVSPDSRTVAYADQGAIWLVPLEGGPPKRLLEAGSPVWLDDDSLIVSVERDDTSRLAVVDVHDPWPRRLVREHGSLDPHGEEVGAVVSPDRSSVAYTFQPRADLNRSEIRVVALESGEARALSGEPSVHDRSPEWSRDGKLIAYSSESSGWYELHLVGADGSDARQLTNGEADFFEHRWHPDGSRLVAARGRHGRYDLVVVDAASGEVTELASGGYWETPQWTADGRIVATYEDHATAPELRLVAPGSPPETLLAPSAARRRPSAPRRPRGDLVPLVRRRRGARVSLPSSRRDGRATRSRRRVPPRRADLRVRRRVGRACAVLRGQGLRVDRAELPRLDGLRPRLRAAAPRPHRRGRHEGLPRGRGLTCARSTGWTASGSRSSARAGARSSHCSRSPTTPSTASAARSASTATATSSRRGRRAIAGACSRRSRTSPAGRPSRERRTTRARPCDRLDQVQVPILVAHGEKDERVHPKQSEELVAELERLGKTYEYVTYPTEAHGLLRAGPQIDFYRRLERFLDWYLL